jgi:hypothetical protein
MQFRFMILLAALSLAACARNIPGTDIAENPDNREIIAIVDAYRKAFDSRNLDGIMALVSPLYYDDAGTVTAEDDIDYKGLPQALKETFSRISQVRIEFGITAIAIAGDKANVDLFYDAKYRVTTPRAEIPRRDTDVQRLVLQRDGPGWKILSGL